jgi:apolipoprotein D and lipocalin family protein
MKTLCIIAFVMLTAFTNISNKTVDKVDLKRFAGKWYSLYSIPTPFDKNSMQTTTTYTLNKDGYFNVFTSGKKTTDNEEHTYNSKLFPVDGSGNGKMKAQFLWPFKVDYWIVDIADDYSWVVVGHPDHKFLFIMSRKPAMDKKLHEELVARCAAMGYDTGKLTSQKFTAD